ncbi:CbtB domain-containing protein [Xanthobacter oligotrophicus]|uniref:CbtB domain-containing protein n=1 Tax=Xanthobacter oligotrophicus TaxID=2607286 RepID=A0ABW6ZRU0_9HYPH
MMTTQTQSPNPAAAESGVASRAVQITLAGLLGLFIVGGVGFSGIPVLHNAAHDYRHSTGFPCH